MTTTQNLDRSGPYEDPAGEPPWVMQLVMRVDKDNPPTREDACTAAAHAVASYILDPRTSEGEWAQPTERWMAGRIRKHARRARGAAWDKTQQHPHVEATVGGSTVRAFVPTSVAEIPKELRALQLSGTDLRKSPNVSRDEGEIRIRVTPLASLSIGKTAAACAHAAQVAVMTMTGDEISAWRSGGSVIKVTFPDAAYWDDLVENADVSIEDAGFTEVTPNTVTAIANWR